jgi:hypothetical protein
MVKMDMTVEVVPGLKRFQQPAEGFDPLVGEVLPIMNPPRRRVRDEDIQVTAIPESIPNQPGDEVQDMMPHLSLRILIKGTIGIQDAAFDARY